MIIYEIQSDIAAIEKNSALYEESNFDSRVEAIDYVEFHIIDRIEGLLHTTNQPEELTTLKQSAERVKRQLEDVDHTLFQRLRAAISIGVCRGVALKGLIDKYVRGDSTGGRRHDEIGYDGLDLFINGLLLVNPIPIEINPTEPEMVFYQQTPVRIILEMIEKADLTKQDVFYDLGSGLGQVAILVHLLSGVTAKGIEFEPAYCDYAKEGATSLNLTQVEFINADARKADYSDGTVFFMYTPFRGTMLNDVLERLRRESRQRTIRLYTYGPCTAEVSRQTWLKGENGSDLYKLGVFTSL
jgi:hypothetical protein